MSKRDYDYMDVNAVSLAARKQRPRAAAAPDEARVVARARAGSSEAFERLVRAHGPRLYRFLALRVGDERDARDAMQETLVTAWRALPSLRRLDHFWPWLVGIAAHKAADVARSRRPTVALEDDLVAASDGAEWLEIRETLDALPHQFREILLLRFFLSLSEEETALALKIRPGTVKSRTARARRAFRELSR